MLRYTVLHRPIFLLALVGCLLSCRGAPEPAAPEPAAEPEPTGGPRLVLLLAVDQMRADYLERFAPVLEGGLKRLADDGVAFTDAHHEHALTLTGPGHATLATGLHPRHHGIVGNSWYSREAHDDVYSAGDSDQQSPENLLGTALGDWLKRRSERSRVFSVSGKDRASVLLGGHRADAAFWYNGENGGFVSSPYYGEALPPWVEAFNDERHLDVHFGRLWEPRPFPAELLGELGIEDFDAGPYDEGLPRSFGGASPHPEESFYWALRTSPLSDAQMARFAMRLIDEEGLGSDGWPDVLALSFSALDAVGHTYGPHSREFLDVIVSLDQSLGELLAHIDAKVGRDRVVIAFSGDHGVVPTPEIRQRHGLAGRRLGREELICIQQARRVLTERFGPGEWFERGLYLDLAHLEASGVDAAAVEGVVAAHLETCPSVAEVWTRGELAGERPGQGPFAALYWNAFHPDRSPDFIPRFTEFFLGSRSHAASHGSPYPYDTAVPLIFVAPGCPPATVAERAATVDLAPTLAALAGIEAPAGLDGTDRSAAVCPPTAHTTPA